MATAVGKFLRSFFQKATVPPSLHHVNCKIWLQNKTGLQKNQEILSKTIHFSLSARDIAVFVCLPADESVDNEVDELILRGGTAG